ncbi:hypothetical protein ACLOJK_004643 [Asimina triloba]
MEKMRDYFTLDNLPLGFRFRPTDEELINHYLKNKVNGVPFDVDVIPEVDVCKCEPEELPEKSWIKTDDPEWFFFSRRDPISSKRSNRATRTGYWKPTGKDREIKSKSSGVQLIGMKKTLVFHRGRAPKGKGTGWIIHEYRLTEDGVNGKRYGQAAFVLCRLFKGADKKIQNSNCNDMDESSLFPATNTSSPDKTQEAGDSIDQIQRPLNQGILAPGKQGDSQWYKSVDDELQAEFDRWLAEEEDSGMSFLPALKESQLDHMSGVKDQNAGLALTEVRKSFILVPKIISIGVLVDKPMETLEADSSGTKLMNDYQMMLLDIPFEDGFTDPQYAHFQASMAEKDGSSGRIREWFDANLSDNSEENVIFINSIEQDNLYPELDINQLEFAPSGNTTQSSGPFSINCLTRADPWESELDSSGEDSKKSFRMRPAHGPRAATLVGFVPEPVNITVTSFRKTGPYVSSVPYVCKSRKDASYQGSADDSRTHLPRSGIRIRSRKSQHSASSHRSTRGEAPRRIHIRMRFQRRKSRNASESSSNKKENEIKAAMHKARRNFHDAYIKGKEAIGPACADKFETFHHQGIILKELSASKLRKLASEAHHLANEFQRKVSIIISERSGKDNSPDNNLKPHSADRNTGEDWSSTGHGHGGLSEMKHEHKSWNRSRTGRASKLKGGNDSYMKEETGKHRSDYESLPTKLNQKVEKKHGIFERRRHGFRKIKVEKEL